MSKKSSVLSKPAKYLIAYVVASLIMTAFLVYSGILDIIEKWAESNNLYSAHLEDVFVASIVLGIAVMFFLFHSYFKKSGDNRLRSKYDSALSPADEEVIRSGGDRENVLSPVLTAKKELEHSLDSIEDMVILCDTDGMIHRCNRAFKDFVGCEYGEILGKHLASILSAFGVETKDLDLKHLHARVHVMGKWFAVNSYPYEDVATGAAVRIVLVMRTLADPKESGKIHFVWGRCWPGGQRSAQEFRKRDLP